MDLEEFLKNAPYFDLGHLPTEGFHPATQNLSDLVQVQLPDAIRVVQQIDIEAMQSAVHQQPIVHKLQESIRDTLQSGHRIFLSGCGATGRLALALEFTWRQTHAGRPALQNRVQGLMAGGDFALVKSVENFEDFPQYGERHLLDLGFQDGDLLIAITEGGETPYVIGTVHAALRTSSRSPWFVYCNPTELLCRSVERSREVIEHPRVSSLCLNTGAMALSGSTRLQAATAQMLAVGAALFEEVHQISSFIEAYSKLDLPSFLTPVVDWESLIYKREEFTLYQTSTYPIAVLTDTTERSPTFSLTAFEKLEEIRSHYSWCYLTIPETENALEAWVRILGRAPIGLDWPELHGRLNLESILGFDFSKNLERNRAKKVGRPQHLLQINSQPRTSTGQKLLEFAASDLPGGVTQLKLCQELVSHPLWEQLVVKMILNIHSLMVMGKMQRFEGNVMTWVRPSNGKLIDRTARYLEFLIKKRGLATLSRQALVQRIFEYQSKIGPDEAVILRLLQDHHSGSLDSRT